MQKYFTLTVLLGLVVLSSGCETVGGAATGLGKDVKNVGDPDKNGWNQAKKLDVWIQENLW